MVFTPYQLFLAGLMLITGSINTLSTKWADRQKSHFCDGSGENVTFEHPFLQGVGMFMGEFLCLLAFKFIWYSTARYRIENMTYKGDASSRIVRYWPIRIKKEIHLVDGEQTFNPFIFWFASLCDMLSTCLSYIALNYTSASSFQMLRGSVMVFTALLSVAFLRKRLSWKHWLGIIIVVAGLAVVGVSDILFSKHPEGNHTNTEKIAGDALILVAMLFTSCQVVYEERFIGKYNIPPLQAVGWEGIFGFSTLGLLLIPFYFIIVPTSNSGPDHRLEDVLSAFCQMRGNWIIILATIGNVLSIAFFNFAGISVTKELSATTRMVLDSGRTLIIWVASLALQWQAFYPLQILGFVFLVIGMGVYNGVWEHLIRRFISSPPISTERSQLLPSQDDVTVYQSTSIIPSTGNIVSDDNAERLYIHDKLVRLEPITNEHINYLELLESNSTIDFWTDIVSLNKSIDIHLRKNEFEKYISQFKQYSLPFKILIDDLQKVIDDEQQQIEQDHLMRRIKSRWYGQMKPKIVGTYASYDEMIEFIQDKANTNPMYIKIINLGQTFEGRLIKAISLQFNPSAKRNIWIDCGIHAREWITPATCIWIIDRLIEEYRNYDPTIRELLNYWNVYIAPSINPDGYEYSRTTGNRLWRKNRSIYTNSFCAGVDLNRNYPWKWMTGGSSNMSCSEIYAGKSAGSEIETQNVMNFLQSKVGTWDMYVSFHSYGQWWLTPYGYSTNVPVNYGKLLSLAQSGANAIEAVNNRKYSIGSISNLLYIASGSTVDWAYDILRIPFSYTIELAPGNDGFSTGFLLPPDQAPGVCNETYIGMKVFMNGIKKEVETTLNG